MTTPTSSVDEFSAAVNAANEKIKAVETKLARLVHGISVRLYKKRVLEAEDVAEITKQVKQFYDSEFVNQCWGISSADWSKGANSIEKAIIASGHAELIPLVVDACRPTFIFADHENRNQEGNSIIHLAVISLEKPRAMIRALNNAGINMLKEKNKDELTPYDLAVQLNNEEAIAVLTEMGAAHPGKDPILTARENVMRVLNRKIGASQGPAELKPAA